MHLLKPWDLHQSNSIKLSITCVILKILVSSATDAQMHPFCKVNICLYGPGSPKHKR